MNYRRFVRSVPRAQALLGLIAILLALNVRPARANTGPPPAILIHVQEPDYLPCATRLTDCEQVVRNTTAGGTLEFQIYLYKPYAYWEINRLYLPLTWPDAWYCWGWWDCAGGSSNWTWNGLGWVLDVSWADCPVVDGMFLVGGLVFDVAGPGRLDFQTIEYDGWGAGRIWWGCPPPGWEDWAIGACAVAGTDCEYTRYACGEPQRCLMVFDATTIHLTAPVGGKAAGEMDFWCYGVGCGLTPHWDVPWLTAGITPLQENYRHRLRVKAEASNLSEGQYGTRIQIVGLWDRIARCIPVTFVVEGNSSVPDDDHQVRCTWGAIRSGYR